MLFSVEKCEVIDAFWTLQKIVLKDDVRRRLDMRKFCL